MGSTSEFVEILLNVLDAAEANYSLVVRALNKVIQEASPTEDDLKSLGKHLAPGVTAVAHVFGRLPAAWLMPLRKERVFEFPPDVQIHEGGSFSFPSWPQAAYLERVASEAPKEVTETILSVPTVDNETIHWHFLRAA